MIDVRNSTLVITTEAHLQAVDDPHKKAIYLQGHVMEIETSSVVRRREACQLTDEGVNDLDGHKLWWLSCPTIFT